MKILADKTGNFGILTAVVLPVILVAGGISIDLSNMLLTKTNLQNAIDAASLGAAAALASDQKSVAEAKKIAMNIFTLQFSGLERKTSTEMAIEAQDIPGGGKSFKVDFSATYELQLTPFTGLLGRTSSSVSAYATTISGTESKHALSMYFVLDRSYSMSGRTSTRTTYTCPTRASPHQTCSKRLNKIESLKVAVADLTNKLDVSDPTHTYVRTGAVSYHNQMQAPTPLTWGTQHTLNYVNALFPEGDTDSSTAFRMAYESLISQNEENEHRNKSRKDPSKYIIFMTDGSNSLKASDAMTKEYCDKARKSKIDVFTVAFMAPLGGQELLKYCASTVEHYFSAEGAGELISAFQSIGEKTTQAATRLTK